MQSYSEPDFDGNRGKVYGPCCDVKWNRKVMKIEVLVVNPIHPPFIGDINAMKSFGIRFAEGNNLHTGKERITFAQQYMAANRNDFLIKLISKSRWIFMSSKFYLSLTKMVEHILMWNNGPIVDLQMSFGEKN